MSANAEKPLPFLFQFTAGAIAGVSEILCMYPLDVAKTRLMLQVGKGGSDQYKSIFDVFSRIIKEEGASRLYRGILPPIMVEAPKRAIKFASNDTYGPMFQKLFNSDKITQPIAIMTGVSAGITEAVIVATPELVKIRLQAKENAGKYLGTMDCVRKIYAEEGIRAFANGLEATVWRHALWNGGYFGSIFAIRGMLPKAQTKKGELAVNFAAGAIGGTIGTSLNTPSDVVKTRIQNHNPANGPPKYTTFLAGARTIAREEGFRALYKGYVPKVLRLGPGGGILLVVYEYVTTRPGVRVEESSVRRLVQAAYRSKLHYTRARWVHRNDCQIEREHDSDITPERRRKLMRLEQTSEVERKNGVPKWPSTMKKRDDEFRRYAARVQAAISAGRSASEIVDYVAGSSRLRFEHVTKGSEEYANLLEPLLATCPSFSSAAITRIFWVYNMRLSDKSNRYRRMCRSSRTYLGDAGFPAHLYAKELTISVDMPDVYSGAALKILSSESYINYTFPIVRSIIFMFSDSSKSEEPTFIAITSPDTESNTSAFVQRIKQIAPMTKKVTIRQLSYSRNGPQFSVQQFISTVAQLSRHVIDIEYELYHRPVIIDQQLNGLRNLAYCSFESTEGGEQIMQLARRNASTLQFLKIDVYAIVDITGLIQNDDGGYVQYPYLHTFKFSGKPGSDVPRQLGFPGAVPFPSLRQLDIGYLTPFGDDAVFREMRLR
ncbi:hypothetical protein GGH94_005221 [Coemansia aciculifera]|uniref:Mitochondrial carrier n=1 Tax=Coemansia aciculifera TaxID=417176 RepID=A0A9W8IGL4_9FUNG|nr:hypothetical protein GGH94_005221 [Coemansia aciculifera]